MAERQSLQVADINISSSGDNTIINATTSGPIKVYKMWIVSGGAVNLIFKHGSTGFNAGAIPLIANGSSMFFAYDSQPYFAGDVNEAFKINLSGAVQVSGQVYYTVG